MYCSINETLCVSINYYWQAVYIKNSLSKSNNELLVFYSTSCLEAIACLIGFLLFTSTEELRNKQLVHPEEHFPEIGSSKNDSFQSNR